MNEYLYAVTSTNDSATNPNWVGRYANALDAVNVFNSFIDYGDAKEYRTVNLSEPNGKLHTKIFYSNGNVGGK
jgi:antitoxin component YwqK of YwqJK toxin-antitoxin module